MMGERDDPEAWGVLGSTYLYRSPWLTVRQDRVRLGNGVVLDDFHILEYPDWANVVAVDEAGRVVLIRQYRHGWGAVHYEIPGGVCDAEDAGPEASARRELLEETGYGGGEWSALATLSANPATHSNRCHSFLATGVSKVGEPSPEADEEIHVHTATPDELRAILAAGGVVQALHVAPLLQYLLSLQGGLRGTV